MQPGPISLKLSNRFVAAMLCTVATMAVHMPQSSFASEIRVISSGAVREVVEEAVPVFESSSGHKLSITWAGSADIRKRIAAGETYDVVIASRSDIDGFIKAEKLASDSALGLMKSGVGIAVKEGDPKPDFRSTETFNTAIRLRMQTPRKRGRNVIYAPCRNGDVRWNALVGRPPVCPSGRSWA